MHENYRRNERKKQEFIVNSGDSTKKPKTEYNDAEIDDQNIASKEEVIQALKQLFKKKPDSCEIMAHYAKKLLYAYGNKEEIDGNYADDIVEIAFEKILTIKRKWYKDRIDTIEYLIYLAILSEIRNLAKKQNENYDPLYDQTQSGNEDRRTRKQKTKVIPLYPADKSGKIKENSIADEINAKAFKEENIYSDDETDFEELVSIMEKELETKSNKESGMLAFYVLQARLEGNRSNIEFAKELGVEVSKVENAVKILKRVFLNKTH